MSNQLGGNRMVLADLLFAVSDRHVVDDHRRPVHFGRVPRFIFLVIII